MILLGLVNVQKNLIEFTNCLHIPEREVIVDTENNKQGKRLYRDTTSKFIVVLKPTEQFKNESSFVHN